MSGYILSIDQGTTSTRAILFDTDQQIVATGQKEFTQHFPDSGWVEHDALEIWSTVVETCKQAIEKAGINAAQIAGIGITNQRETTVLWDKKTGKPIHNAIVWQDRRTADFCDKLRGENADKMIVDKTGLLLDPYFSGTKIAWLLDNVAGARAAAQKGDVLFGTIDCYLLWMLTGGAAHKTDATNASRTMIYNIHENEWDNELCTLLNIPMAMLPRVEDCNHDFGVSDASLLGAAIPIAGIAGDQHAASIGQACFEPGMIKSTYGTGCFAMMNTGIKPSVSKNKMLTTICYRIDGQTHYALEGSVYIAGAAVQWLRDGLKIIDNAPKSTQLAAQADPNQRLILVPAFAGLGAPYWEPNVRGSIFGLTRNSGPAEFSRAALEAVCFQTKDLVRAMLADFEIDIDKLGLRVDGGMAASDWTMQFLSDLLECPVDRPQIVETTALGAAWLAGYQSGVWPDQKGFAKTWNLDRRFTSQADKESMAKSYSAWGKAVEATIAQSK